MSKIWYSTTTNQAAVFDDDAVLSDWPDFQETQSIEVFTEAQSREKRGIDLAESDIWALTDRTMTDEQIAYRQALRDLPSQEGWPTNITWPTKPLSAAEQAHLDNDS
tara:strand:- start:70 stop:390 length:321 start_codon:yes stop_codon:yes gene_type:complete